MTELWLLFAHHAQFSACIYARVCIYIARCTVLYIYIYTITSMFFPGVAKSLPKNGTYRLVTNLSGPRPSTLSAKPKEPGSLPTPPQGYSAKPGVPWGSSSCEDPTGKPLPEGFHGIPSRRKILYTQTLMFLSHKGRGGRALRAQRYGGIILVSCLLIPYMHSSHCIV